MTETTPGIQGGIQERTVYALKGSAEWAGSVYESLAQGEARFGWSYVQTADLRQLAHKMEATGWKSLSAEEQACYHHFLLGIMPGDYVVYINVPTWGQCTLARVTAPYSWRWTNTDFNHRLGVDPTSVQTFGPFRLLGGQDLRAKPLFAKRERCATQNSMHKSSASPLLGA